MSNTELQVKRVARAANEMSRYTFAFVEFMGVRAVEVAKRDGSGSYYVTGTKCSCPDHTGRLAGTGVECKHQIMARLWASQEKEKRAAEEKRARVLADRALWG